MTEAESLKMEQIRSRWSGIVKQPLGSDGHALAQADVQWLVRQLKAKRGEVRSLRQALVDAVNCADVNEVRGVVKNALDGLLSDKK